MHSFRRYYLNVSDCTTFLSMFYGSIASLLGRPETDEGALKKIEKHQGKSLPWLRRSFCGHGYSTALIEHIRRTNTPRR